MCGCAVEWLRSCYASRWRLFRDTPEIETPGFYVFTPDGNPDYDGFHNFGSRNWTSDERDPEPQLGEVTDAQQSWMDGAPSAGIPAGSFLGTRGCIEEGELWPLPVIDREIIGGFDSRCPQLAQQTAVAPLFIDVRNCRTQQRLANVLVRTYDAAPAAANKFQEYWPDAFCTSVDNRPDTTTPGSMIAVQGDTTVVFVSGTTNPQQWALQTMDGLEGLTDYGQYSTLRLWNDAANALVRRIYAAALSSTGPIIFVGHSYGAAVACILAFRYSVNNPDRPVQLLTCGSPKPGDSRLTGQLNSLRQVHLINDDDPVTFLPPSGIDAVVLGSVVPSAGLLRWQNYSRPSDRIGVRTDGTRFDNPQANSVFALLFRIMTQVNLGQEIQAITAHAMTEYARRIVCPTEPTPAPTLPFYPVWWLDSDSIASLADGDPVDTWVDSSASKFDATALPTGISPVKGTDVSNGKAYASMKYPNGFQIASLLYLQNQWSVYIVTREAGPAGRCNAFLSNSSDPTDQYAIRLTTNNFAWADGTQSGSFNPGAHVASQVWSLRRRPDAWDGGFASGGQAGGLTALSGLLSVDQLSSFGPLPASDPPFRLYEVIVYDYAHTDDEQAQVIAYLRAKYVF